MGRKFLLRSRDSVFPARRKGQFRNWGEKAGIQTMRGEKNFKGNCYLKGKKRKRAIQPREKEKESQKGLNLLGKGMARNKKLKKLGVLNMRCYEEI